MMELSLSITETPSIILPLLTILPLNKSFEEYCIAFKSNNQSNTITSFQLNLFYYIAYNQAIKPTTLRDKLKDFRLFIFINNFKPHTKRMAITQMYTNIINLFITELTSYITNKSYDNDSTMQADLYYYIYQVEMKLFNQLKNNSYEKIRKAINGLKNALQKKQKQSYDNNTNNFYGQLFNCSPMAFASGYQYSYNIDNMEYSHRMSFGDKDKATDIIFPISITSTLSYYDSFTIQNEHKGEIDVTSLTKALSQPLNIPVTYEKKIFNRKLTSSSSTSHKKTLSNIIEELYKNQMQNGILLKLDSYQTPKYSLQLIGSYSYFYNTISSQYIDFVLIANYPKQNNISSFEIITWLHDRTINGMTFKYDYSSPTKLIQNTKNKNDGNFLAFQCFHNKAKYTAIIYIQCEKYLKCSQIIQSIFTPKSKLAKFHLFIKPILKYLTSIEVIFLLLSFLNHKHNLFDLFLNEIEMQNSQCDNNHTNFKVFKEKCNWYEISNKALIKIHSQRVEVLIMHFLKYYYGLNQSSLNGSYKMNDPMMNPNYIFSIKNIVSIRNQFDQDYWNKINRVRDKFQKNTFGSYDQILKHFNIII